MGVGAISIRALSTSSEVSQPWKSGFSPAFIPVQSKHSYSSAPWVGLFSCLYTSSFSIFSSEDAICAHSGIYSAISPIVNTTEEERGESGGERGRMEKDGREAVLTATYQRRIVL